MVAKLMFMSRLGQAQFCDTRDARYDESGAIVGTRGDVISKSSVLFSIHPPVEDFDSLSGKAVVSWVGRLTDVGKAEVLNAAQSGIMLIDVTAVPRVTIARQRIR